MENVTKGATGTILSSLFVGASYLNNLFYRLTVLADPRWPPAVEKTALLFSFMVGLGVSIGCATIPNERLSSLFKITLVASILMLILSFAMYLSVDIPLVKNKEAMMLVDVIWKVIDLVAMSLVVATVSFGSLRVGSSIWSLFPT